MIRWMLLCILFVGSFGDRLFSANLVEEDGFGLFHLNIDGDFDGVEKTKILVVNGNIREKCEIKSATDSAIKCSVSAPEGVYDILMEYQDSDKVDQVEHCQNDECHIRLDIPGVDLRIASNYPRPRSRIEDGRRGDNYQEPPGNSYVPKANTPRYWNWEENWPVMYNISQQSNTRVSTMGGVTLTIEGKNLGSILSSFGEEDRDDNVHIELYFVRDNNEHKYPKVPCVQIAHYHNPTQLFCRLDKKFPEFHKWYYLNVKINGQYVNHHCGCRGCTHMCRVYADNHHNPNIEFFLAGNLVAPSKPQWTEWFSYESTDTDEDTQTRHDFFHVYSHYSNFKQTIVCPAPIAMQARNKETLELVSPDGTEFIFAEFNNQNAACNKATELEPALCHINEFEFRYFCDRSTVNMLVSSHDNDFSQFVYHDAAEDENRITGIYIEDEKMNRIDQCIPSYEAEDASHVMSLVDVPKTEDRIKSYNCRIDSNKVGHYHLSMSLTKMGRMRNPRQEGKFFDENGIIKSFTLAPGIDSIEPMLGSTEGGTLITIRGKGFDHEDREQTEVLVGGDPCIIKSIKRDAIICRTTRPSYNTEMEGSDRVFIGGAGAKTYFFDKESNTIQDYRDVDRNTAKTTRHWGKGYYGLGVQQSHVRFDMNNYVGIMEAAFIPPVTGYYTIVKYTDDHGMLWMHTEGGSDTNREDQEKILDVKHVGGIPWNGPEHLQASSEKMLLQAGVPYPFEDFYIEYGGGDWGSLGYIFHGQDKDYNMRHEPVEEIKNNDWDESYHRIQVISEKQRHKIASERRREKHRIRLQSDPEIAGNLRFALRWSNDNGEIKDTPFGHFDDFRRPELVRTLLSSKCESMGEMNVRHALDAEENVWPWGYTNDEAYCGARSFYARWRWIMENKHFEINTIPSFCLAHFGEVSSRAELRMLVGWVRQDTEGTNAENLEEKLTWQWIFIRVEDKIPEIYTRHSWEHVCFDIRALVNGHEILTNEETTGVHPDWANHIYVRGMYLAHTWGYVDQIEIGEAEAHYSVDRTEAAHRPNTHVTYIDHRTHGRSEISHEYRTSQCGVDIPEMTVIAEPGVAVTVTDVNIWDDFGNPIIGKSYELTDPNSNKQLIIEVLEAVKISPGVTGFFQFNYKGQETSIIDLATPALDDYTTKELNRIHEDIRQAEVSISGNCNDGWTFDVTWEIQGDFEDLNMVGFNLTGVDLDVTSNTLRSGGVYVRAIPGGQMATLSAEPQVQVKRRNILAQCNSMDCGFQFSQPGIVTALQPHTFDELSETNQLKIKGTKLRNVNLVTIGGMHCYESKEFGSDCQIISAKEKEVIVEFSFLPYGSLEVRVYTDHGLMRIKTENAEHIVVSAQEVTVSPTGGTLNGGNIITLTGNGVGLGDNQVVLVVSDDDRRPAKTISRSPHELVVQTPAGDKLGDFDVGFSNGVMFAKYTYTNKNEVRFSINKKDFSVKGQNVRVTFKEKISGTVVLILEEEEFSSYEMVNEEVLKLTMPPNAPGKGKKLKFYVPGAGWTNSVNVRYRLTVESVTPMASSTSGGALLTVSGVGFGDEEEDAKVTVGGRPCLIEEITNSQILCRTTSYYKEHNVFLTGSSWFPQKLTVHQNDLISWSWLTEEAVSVQIESIDDPNDVTPNNVFSIPKKHSTFGTVSRYMSESPGVYHYTSGYLDDFFSQFANGEIRVAPAQDYQVEVEVRVVGFSASVEDNLRQNQNDDGCVPLETDIKNKDPSVLVEHKCLEAPCLTHTYSFQRTPVATSASLDEGVLTISAGAIEDHDGCPGMFTAIGWSKDGQVRFDVERVVGDTLKATMESPSADWPFGEALDIRVMQANRGTIQINSGIFKNIDSRTTNVFKSTLAKFTVSPVIKNVTPRIGSHRGGATVTVIGEGLKFSKYKVVRLDICDEVLSHTDKEIKCTSKEKKHADTIPIVLRYYYDERTLISLVNTELPGDYIHDSGYKFEFREVRKDNIEGWYDDTDLYVQADISLPTAAINLRAYCIEDGKDFDNIEDRIAGEIVSNEICEASACYTIRIRCPNTTPNQYKTFLKMDNLGVLDLGDYFRGYRILSKQFKEGSQGGNHVLRLSTSDNMGQFPEDHFMIVWAGGHDLCDAEENYSKDHYMPAVCTVEATSENEFTIVMPALMNSLVNHDDIHVRIEFRRHGRHKQNLIIMNHGVRDYRYKKHLTPTVELIYPRSLVLDNRLQVTLRNLEELEDRNICENANVFVGQALCDNKECDEELGMITCTAPPLPAGSYKVRVNFDQVGDARYPEVVSPIVKYRFEVAGIFPLTGSFGGGTRITFIGAGFSKDTLRVSLCGKRLDECWVNDIGTRAICGTPNIGAEANCRFVFDTDNRLVARQDFDFNFDASLTPIVDSITPSMGGSHGGTLVTVTGSNFAVGNQTVEIGSSQCIIQSETATEIICLTEPHPTSTKHRLLVKTPTGDAAAPEITGTFWYIDRWSSVFTWGCNDTSVDCENKPVDFDIAVIPKDTTILLDESTPLLSVLLVQGGTLLWDRKDGIKLRAQYVLVTDDGTFEMGTEEEPFCGPDPAHPLNAEIELFGHSRSIRLPVYGAKVFAVRKGTLDIHGCPLERTWTVINQTIEAGDDTLHLKNSVFNPNSTMTSWKVGDEVVIGSTGGRNTVKQNERKTIIAISDDGHRVTLNESLIYRHIYHQSFWDGEELEIAAEVGVLTRNIKIYGNENKEWTKLLPECDEDFDPEGSAIQTCYLNKWGDEIGSDEFGAHIIMHYIKRGRIAGVEITHAGQAFQLGRYATHFHNSGNCPDSYISHCGIHNTFNRAVTLHGVWNATVDWNVAYNCMGHNFFIEDAVEEDNYIEYNLAMRIKPSHSMANSDLKAAGFWITNTMNTIQHNHAVGGAQTGFWINPPPVSGHANADCPPIVRSHCPIYTPVKKWFNNTAHDMGWYGFWIWSDNPKANYNPSTADCRATWPPGQAYFEKGRFWNCFRGAEFAQGGDNIQLHDFIVANNILGGLSFKESYSWRYEGTNDEYFTGIVNSKVIGYVDSEVPELSLCTRFGVETPWKPHGQMKTDGLKFYNFDRNDQGGMDHCVAIDACYSSYPFDCGRTSHWNRIEYTNSPRKFAADWEHETALVDLDGSLTGMNVPGYTVVPKSNLYPQSMCTDAPEFSVQFPCQFCNSIEFNRFGANQILPDSIGGYTMVVTNKWGTSMVPFRNSRSTHPNGWMGLLLAGETHDIHFEYHEHITNISYSGAIYDFGQEKTILLRHPFYQSTDYAEINGCKMTKINASEVGDFGECFNGDRVEDGVFTTTTEPLSYYINPIDNGLTYSFARDTSPNKFYDISYRFNVFKCFWPGCVPPTTPPPTTPPVISHSCDWSDPGCWENGTLPLPGQNVTIPIDKEVTIDTDIDVDILYVEGTVKVGNQTDITITARVILINTGMGLVTPNRNSIQFQNGNFYAGSEGEPWSCTNTLTINFTGDRFQTEFGAPFGSVPIGAKTIGVMGGLKLYGCPKNVNWGLLQNGISPGDNSIKLDRDVSSWSVGDELAIAPTSYDSREAEKVVITAINGNQVTFSQSVNFTHTGVNETQRSYGHMGAEVINLSRNIKLNGYAGSEDMFGGRVVVLKSDNGFTYRKGWAQIDNVEFVHMGQFGHTRADDFRSPVAFYQIGAQEVNDPKRSFVSNSAFHDTFNSGIFVGKQADAMEVTGNVIFNCVNDAIETHAEDTLISDNVIIKVVMRALHHDMYLTIIMGDSKPDQFNLPAGVNLLNTKTAILLNNRVAGGDGPAYKGHGTVCMPSAICQPTEYNMPTYNNVGHSTLRGYSIVKVVGRHCAEYSGFYFWRIVDFGIYTQAKGSNLLIRNNVFVDATTGVANLLPGNGIVVKHEHGDMKIAIDGNLFIGRSDHHTCQDYAIRSNSLIITSGTTNANRADPSPLGGPTAIYMPFFCEKFNKFPKVPLHHPVGAGYNSLAGRSCVSGNHFVNFNDDSMCSEKGGVVITSNGLTHDHQHMVEMQKTVLTDVPDSSLVTFHRPNLKLVSIDNCVDMACDGARRYLIKDLDGSLTGNSAEISIFAQSEYHWDGVDGFDWSDNIDPSWGIGDYRIPESMQTMTNGTVIPIDIYAPNKGHSQSDNCIWKNEWNAYQCEGSIRGHLLFESLDRDTEIRRSAPIGFRSSTGYIDLANGPKDGSCCSGYSCLLRATYNYFIVECGETYHIHTSGTLPTKVQFAMHNLPASCKIRLQMYTMRQNRQDVYLNGDNIIYSNQYDFENETWRFPDPKLIPSVNDNSGANYFDRADQILHFIVGGGDMLQVRIANSLILTLDVVTEMTIEEFYASSNLPYLLAVMLGLDPSQVKIVSVVRETNPEKYWSQSDTVVTKPWLAGKNVNRVKVEFSTELGKTSGGFPQRAARPLDPKKVGNQLVAHQMTGTLETLIQEASGSNMEIPATKLTSQAIEGETPSWYTPGTDGEEQSILTQLNIDPDSIDAESVVDIVEETAAAMNLTSLLNHTNADDQADMEATIDQTTQEVRYDSKPTTMVIVQQIPQKIFVGSYMRYPIKVAMLNEKGESMTEVGYMGDPMKVTAFAPGAGLVNSETYFTPGNGIANFGTMVFTEPGRFNLEIKLTYTGVANVTVNDIYTISFEVTEDVPARIEVSQHPESPVQQQISLTPIKIVMYDSKDNIMTGAILTPTDPWRVCASLPEEELLGTTNQELLGTTEEPFEDGTVTFSDLRLANKRINQRIRFDLCYAGTSNLADLNFKPVMSNTFDIVNVDECEVGLAKCDVNANCTDTDGAYECTCHDGFIGNGLICMQEIDECEMNIHECDINARCTDAPVGYTCNCINGFDGDGYYCDDIDECESGTHYCDWGTSYCNNTVGDFECICNGGYLSVDGKRCQDVNECEWDDICPDDTQVCINMDGSYKCECGDGYVNLATEGCIDIDECAIGMHNCGENTKCENSIGAYECTCDGGGEDPCKDVECRPGYECRRGQCVDIDECDPANPQNSCQSYETCTNTDPGFTCSFDYNANCPAEKYKVDWKGAKFSKIVRQSTTEVMVDVTVLRKGPVNIRKKTYYGFLVYPRKSCGPDFMKAMLDGRVSVTFNDFNIIYEPKGVFGKQDGAQSSIGIAYRLTKVIDADTPYVYKKKDDKYIKNMKKDFVHLIFSGIDQVEWKNGNMAACLEKAAVGVLPDKEYPESVTACVTTDRKFT